MRLIADNAHFPRLRQRTLGRIAAYSIPQKVVRNGRLVRFLIALHEKAFGFFCYLLDGIGGINKDVVCISSFARSELVA